MFCHQIPMHIINGFYAINSFIIYNKIVNISDTPVFSDSLVVQSLLKFPKHNFSFINWSSFALNFSSCLPLTNK